MQRIKSIKANALLNSIKTLVTILFPLVTVPYLSRVLGKAGYGRFNYSLSIVSYFILIAGLGISTYAIREGSKIRNNKEAFEQFASEVFSLNVVSTLISYTLLGILLIISSSLQQYTEYILSISVEIIFITLGADWINSIFEDYLYITIRYIFMQILSIILMLLFVKNETDLMVYVFVYVFSQVGANISNILYRRKYTKLRIIINRRIFRHFLPVFILFASSLATTIYVNSDITILGIIKGDEAVGVYSVASKIYAGTKQIAIAGTVVTIPRLAAYLGQNKRDKYNVLLNDIINLLISITIPLFTGLFMMSEPIMAIIGGPNFTEGANTLKVLCIASIFSIIAYYFAQCILIPNSCEKYFLYSTIIAAVTNIILNFIIIPYFSHLGAALTTLISEVIVMLFCRHYSKSLFNESIDGKVICSTIITCLLIVIICYLIRRNLSSNFISLIVSILCSGIAYLVIMIAFDNKAIKKLIYALLRRK